MFYHMVESSESHIVFVKNMIGFFLSRINFKNPQTNAMEKFSPCYHYCMPESIEELNNHIVYYIRSNKKMWVQHKTRGCDN